MFMPLIIKFPVRFTCRSYCYQFNFPLLLCLMVKYFLCRRFFSRVRFTDCCTSHGLLNRAQANNHIPKIKHPYFH